MAKSVRASVTKRNRAKLRATVFGPAADARTERLSAKLKELASQPIIREHKSSSMELDSTGTEIKSPRNHIADIGVLLDMDVDTMSVKHTQSRSKKPGRVQKRKKARSSIVFQTHPLKTKKGSRRK
ncbi:hypothetical protein V8F44DRAFT_494491 [Aspergillus fumigatus]|uniref:DUF2423 domain-containing protein n=2 Tax=Aspergillus fumigatus TaxID=746128 RepID=Q4WDM4_ASPFU|nr:conserved hypothetical protein [Aspergillus fumigatus Af293]EAL85514.1 conserved hypothetical protein [Aspergillus fumigatus Af293]EDP47459.1 conserved hypothetical protein [Aspergillus fumigatus A1163]KMK55069.1 hypothetical protein Y699_07174 [Aspergillus fumigatus Z5]